MKPLFIRNLALTIALYLRNSKVAKLISHELRLTFVVTLMAVISWISSLSPKSSAHEPLKASNILNRLDVSGKRQGKVG
jgi:hypothetical protein